MKTVTTIHLNGRAYQVEDEAHKALGAYLDKATAALENNPDKDEILADFEQAIAEKCSRYITPSKNVITHKEIEIIIAEMGPVEGSETTSSEHSHEKTETSAKKPKRLYRDPDNRVIGGVASGLALYFGIDISVVRIVFLVFTFVGGSAVLVYIILWLAVPEAETTAQKLEMRGSHVTLENMTDMLKEKIDEVGRPSKRSAWSKIVSVPLKILRAIGLVIQKVILPAFRTIISVVLMCIGFVGTVIATIGLGFVLFANPAAISDFATITTFTGPAFYVALIAGYVFVIIPLIVMFLIGLSMMQKKNQLKGKFGVSFLTLWFIAIIVCGVSGARTASEIQRSMSTDASFQTIQEITPLSPFTKLEASDRENIIFTEGTEYAVSVEGRARDIEYVVITNNDGTLSIKQENLLNRSCFLFCLGREQVQVTVTAPTLSSIVLKNGTRFQGEMTSDDLSIKLENGSYAKLIQKGKNARYSLSNGSTVDVSGTADMLDIQLNNSSDYNGAEFLVKDAHLSLNNGSQAEVSAKTTLQITANNGSDVTYTGTPRIEKSVRNGSSVTRTESTDTE